MNRRSLIAPAILAAIIAVTAPATADPRGPVVLAKSTSNALLIWQATPFVSALLSRHEPAGRALSELESAALQMVNDRKPLLRKATSVSLKVLYVRTAPQNDPQYAPTSFAGFQQLLVLTVTRSALNDSAKWPKAVDPQHLPPGVTAKMTGKLPN